MLSQNLTFNSSEPLESKWGHCADVTPGIIVWVFFSALFSLVGFPACAAVLWELFQRHRAGTSITPNDVFMINLTVMDLVFLFFVPLGLTNFLLWHIMSFQSFISFLYALNLTGRPLLTACICLDCYMAVFHPIAYSTKKSLTPRVLMAAAAWTATMVQGSMSIVDQEINHSVRATFVSLIALPIIVICDASILWTLKKSYRSGTPPPQEEEGSPDHHQQHGHDHHLIYPPSAAVRLWASHFQRWQRIRVRHNNTCLDHPDSRKCNHAFAVFGQSGEVE